MALARPSPIPGNVPRSSADAVFKSMTPPEAGSVEAGEASAPAEDDDFMAALSRALQETEESKDTTPDEANDPSVAAQADEDSDPGSAESSAAAKAGDEGNKDV